jgi:hypothetical protein
MNRVKEDLLIKKKNFNMFNAFFVYMKDNSVESELQSLLNHALRLVNVLINLDLNWWFLERKNFNKN